MCIQSVGKEALHVGGVVTLEWRYFIPFRYRCSALEPWQWFLACGAGAYVCLHVSNTVAHQYRLTSSYRFRLCGRVVCIRGKISRFMLVLLGKVMDVHPT